VGSDIQCLRLLTLLNWDVNRAIACYYDNQEKIDAALERATAAHPNNVAAAAALAAAAVAAQMHQSQPQPSPPPSFSHLGDSHTTYTNPTYATLPSNPFTTISSSGSGLNPDVAKTSPSSSGRGGLLPMAIPVSGAVAGAGTTSTTAIMMAHPTTSIPTTTPTKSPPMPTMAAVPSATSSSSSVSPPAWTSSPPPSKLTTARLTISVPEGATLNKDFSAEDTLWNVYEYVAMNAPAFRNNPAITLTATHPVNTVFGEDKMDWTLAQAGLVPIGVLRASVER